MKRLCFFLIVFPLSTACVGVARLDAEQFARAAIRSPLINVPRKCADEMKSDVSYPVTARFRVNAEGRVEDVSIIQSTNDCLSSETKSALEQSVFDPEVLTGIRADGMFLELTTNYLIEGG